MTAFILVPGMCHGAWCFEGVANSLRSVGYRVHPVTLSGVAERAHLLAGAVNLDTHIADVLAVVEAYASMDDLVLVGHSYGGMVITGVADRIPERITSMVFVDAVVPQDGEACWDIVDEAERAWYVKVDNTGFGVPPLPFFDPRATSHPLASLMQPLRLLSDHCRFRRTLVYALDWPGESPIRPSYERVRDDPTWQIHLLDGKHDLMRDKPDELLRILLDAAAD
ncbi:MULTISPECIES: alpha/beta fold hydrolase [Mycobacteriaceae]|uniref:Alpha/beta fold hydrolase n=1 Tax=Mycolicibacterium parafortuitum TaxID=39692 RepID=A0ACC6MMN7_MYCPF|nr:MULTISPECIES: alpha/beta hydrolase [Mycobacteriaceae]MDZ5088224.1 alpha/beta fold hydrolase [Mycolicibacterium parafortuitum]